MRRRLAALEARRGSEVAFLLADGTTATMRSREQLTALLEAVDGRDSPRARVMLRAVSSAHSNLFSLAQALSKGPRETL
ncbi:MAG TPA: hypothetical protein VMD25_13710 [Acidobacteriaceae bacterium]|nr:hypothetical protein [Acidobacteriaceae bacterium]